MSDSAYYNAWVADGRPWRLSTPVKECADKIKAARPGINPISIIGTIGDSAHLLATRPEDHTPYSQTGWPVRHPYPNIAAIDIMHRPDLGMDCNAIFPHWLAAARAGQLPWLKYVIWQAKRYDVRNSWNPVSSSGHHDHMHASVRSDHITSSIGSFHPLPGMDDDMDFSDTIPGSGNKVAEHFTDLQAVRDRLIDPAAAAVRGHTGYPRPGSALDHMERLPEVAKDAAKAALAEASLPVHMSDFDRAAIIAGLKAELPAVVGAALLQPEVLAALAKAVADEDHRRSAA
jgi:hypothetical protein